MTKIIKLTSGSYRTRIFLGKENGKSVYKSITRPTKEEVMIAASEFLQQKRDVKKKTVRKAVEDYIEISRSVISPTTIHSYEKILAFAFPCLMPMNILDLNATILQKEINRESRRVSEKTGKPLSAKTVKNEWGLISAALKHEGLSFNIKLPKVQHKNEALPEPEDIFKSVVGSRIEIPCLLALWCGMRMSEIRGLSYDSIHGNEIWIDKVMVDVGRQKVLKHLAKTDTSIRRVYLPQYIKDLIDNSPYPETYTKDGKYRLIVPLTRDSIYDTFKRLTTKNNVDISFHSLRSIYCSIQLTKLHIAPKIVQIEGGWKTDYVMTKTYSRVFNSAQKEAHNRMNIYCGKLVEKSKVTRNVTRSSKNAEISIVQKEKPWVRVPCPAPKDENSDS